LQPDDISQPELLAGAVTGHKKSPQDDVLYIDFAQFDIPGIS
jgi:hypothetical protein